MTNPFGGGGDSTGGGVDFSQYKNWPMVKAPNGTIYYEIPGSGRLLDPYLSQSKGRPVTFLDPRPEYEKKQAAEKQQQELIDQEKFNRSPGGQLIPVVGTVGGLYAANEFAKPSLSVVKDYGNGTALMSDGTVKATASAAQTATAPAVPSLGQSAADSFTGLPSSQASQDAFNAQANAATSSQPQTLPPGSTPQPDGTVTDAAGNNIGTWAQGIGGAILFYQGYKQYQDGDKIGGGLGMAAGAAYGASAAGLGGSTVAEAAPLIGGAYGAYSLGKLAANSGDLHTSDTGSATMQGASSGAALGAGIGSVFPGVGTAFGAGVGGVIGGLYGLGAGLTASSKGERQVARDKYRENIIKNGVPLFDANYQGDLADGTKYDFGKDKFGFGKGNGDFNLDDPTTAKAAAYGNILGAIQGAQGKGREAIATQFLGASTANAGGDLNKVKANYAHFLNKLGISDLATAQKALDEAKANSGISDADYQVFKSDLNELFAPAPAKPQQTMGQIAASAGQQKPMAVNNAPPPQVTKPSWARLGAV